MISLPSCHTLFPYTTLFRSLSGGFLHIDDNYGMEPYLKKELKKVFPDKDLIELPPDHHLFNQYYKFENGLPKIHEHDGKRPQARSEEHTSELQSRENLVCRL